MKITNALLCLVVFVSALSVEARSVQVVNEVVKSVSAALEQTDGVISKYRMYFETYEEHMSDRALQNQKTATLLAIRTKIDAYNETSALEVVIYNPSTKGENKIERHTFSHYDLIPLADQKLKLFGRNYSAKGEIVEAFEGDLELVASGKAQCALSLNPKALSVVRNEISSDVKDALRIDAFQIGSRPGAVFLIQDGVVIDTNTGESLNRNRALTLLRRAVSEQAHDDKDIL